MFSMGSAKSILVYQDIMVMIDTLVNPSTARQTLTGLVGSQRDFQTLLKYGLLSRHHNRNYGKTEYPEMLVLGPLP